MQGRRTAGATAGPELPLMSPSSRGNGADKDLWLWGRCVQSCGAGAAGAGFHLSPCRGSQGGMGRAIPCGNWAVELSPASAKQQQGSVPCWVPWGQTTAWGQQKSLSSCPFPGPPLVLKGHQQGWEDKSLISITPGTQRFLYLIPLVAVEVVDGSAPPLCSSVSRRPSAEIPPLGEGLCRCFLCAHLPRNKKSPVFFFLPALRQGIPAPGILHIHGGIQQQHLP